MTGQRQYQLTRFLRLCVTQHLIDEQTAEELASYFQRESLRARFPLLGADTAEESTEASPKVAGLLLSPPDPTMTFDSWVPCKANAFPLEVARAVAERVTGRAAYSPLYLYSDIGLGKTHLLSSIYHATQAPGPLLMNAADLETELQRADHVGARMELRRLLATTGMLLVDDIQFAEHNEVLQRELFAVLNHRIAHGLPVVITCDVPPTRLSGIEARLLSRLDGGVIVALQLGERDERMALLRRFFGEVEVDPQIVQYLAEQVTDNVRRLRAVATQLIAMKRHANVEIDLEIARALAPREGDLANAFHPTGEVQEGASPVALPSVIDRFKEMVAGAETEEEQALALQIAVGERLRQLRAERADPQSLHSLEQALSLLREGQLREALTCIAE